jgi:hypothetical protein
LSWLPFKGRTKMVRLAKSMSSQQRPPFLSHGEKVTKINCQPWVKAGANGGYKRYLFPGASVNEAHFRPIAAAYASALSSGVKRMV